MANRKCWFCKQKITEFQISVPMKVDDKQQYLHNSCSDQMDLIVEFQLELEKANGWVVA